MVSWYGTVSIVRVNRRMAECLVTDEWKRTWNEEVMAIFRNLPGGTEQIHEKAQIVGVLSEIRTDNVRV